MSATIAGAYLRGNNLNIRQMKFASTIKDAVHQLLGIPFSCAHYESTEGNEWKDKPNPLFFDRTPREWYIAISEDFLKPLANNREAFGRIQSRLMHMETNADVFIFSDSGFFEEALPIVRKVGPENVLLIELSRPGCSFDGDSRGYISDKIKADPKLRGITCRRINNDDDKDMLRIYVRGAVKAFMGFEE